MSRRSSSSNFDHSSKITKRGSANDRLKSLRTVLQATRGEVTKVHSLIPSLLEDDELPRSNRSFSCSGSSNNKDKTKTGNFNHNQSLDENILSRICERKRKESCFSDDEEGNKEETPLKKVKTERVTTSTPKLNKSCDFTSPLLRFKSSSPNTSSTSCIINENAYKSPSFKTSNLPETSQCKSNKHEEAQDSDSSSSNSYHECMDWEYNEIENKEETKTENAEKEVPEAEVQAQQPELTPNISNNEDDDGLNISPIYIVVDTNIIIHKFEMFKTLFDVSNNKNYVIFIPFQVWRELDHIKDGRITPDDKLNAINAVKFISSKLKNKDPKLQGESIEEVLHSDLNTSGGDESIMACCIRLKRKLHKVVLLSEDVSLRNLAMLSKYEAFSSSEIFTFITSLPPRKPSEIKEDDRIEKLRTELSFLCSFIISKRMENAPSKSWKTNLKEDPPWTLKQCLRLLKVYWNYIAQDSTKKMYLLPKPCYKKVNNFHEFLENNEKISEENFNTFKDYCLDICLYLKEGFPSYKKNITNATEKIRNILKNKK